MERRQWSDVARVPREVAAAVESSGEVCLERRGGEVAFVLSRADRVRHAKHGLEDAAKLLRQLFDHIDPRLVTTVIIDTFPWARFLPEKDQNEFVREFIWTVSACADLDIWSPLGRLLDEWRSTASIHADPELAARLCRAVDSDLGPVIPPAVESDDAEAG